VGVNIIISNRSTYFGLLNLCRRNTLKIEAYYLFIKAIAVINQGGNFII
jgi:hypothetical protein